MNAFARWCILLSWFACAAVSGVFVGPQTGTDTPSCGDTETSACKTLAYAAATVPAANPLVLDIFESFSGRCTQSGLLTVYDRGLIVRGAHITIDCEGDGWAFYAYNIPVVEFANLTIRNTSTGYTGGALAVDTASVVTLTNVTFEWCRTTSSDCQDQFCGGGAVSISDAVHLQVVGCRFSHCSAINNVGGGLYWETTDYLADTNVTTEISQSIFEDNVSKQYGSALCIFYKYYRHRPAAIHVYQSVFRGNALLTDGITEGATVTVAALYSLVNSTIAIDSCKFIGNTAALKSRSLVFISLISEIWGVHLFLGHSSFVQNRGYGLFCTVSGTSVGNNSITIVQNSFVDNYIRCNNIPHLGATCTLQLQSNRNDVVLIANNTMRRNSIDSPIASGFMSSIWIQDSTDTNVTIVGNLFSEGQLSGNVFGAAGLGIHTHGTTVNLLVRCTANVFEHCTSGNTTDDTIGGAVTIIPMKDTAFNTTFEFMGNMFVNNSAGTGGGIIIMTDWEMPSAHYVFINNTFTGNVAGLRAGGAIAFVYAYNIGKQMIVMRGNRFHGNRAALLGGAMAVVTGECYDLTIVAAQDIFNANRAMFGGGISITANYVQATATFSQLQFVRNEADMLGGDMMLDVHMPFEFVVDGCLSVGSRSGGLGGSMLLHGGTGVVNDSTFIGNWAKVSGGALYFQSFSKPAAVTLFGCMFSGFETTDGEGTCVYAEGWNVTMKRTIINVTVVESLTPIVVDMALEARLLPTDVLIQCPSGYGLTETVSFLGLYDITAYHDPSSVAVGIHAYPRPRHSIRDRCIACAEGYYALEAGSNRMNITCHECVLGAVCPSGVNVYVDEGYYCAAVGDPPVLECLRCPDGYCCPERSGCLIGECAAGRTGQLCGSCLPGLSETLGAAGCVPDGECNAGSWVIPLGLVILLVVVVLMVTIEHMFSGRWGDEESNALWKSAVYFYQVANQLLGKGLKGFPHSILLGLLSFGSGFWATIGGSGRCIWKGMTAVGKTAFGYATPMCLLGWLGIVFGIHWTTGWPHSPDATCYWRIFFILLVLSYSTVMSTTLRLLHCVPFGGVSRLFIAGEVECYVEGWHIAIWTVFIGVFLPLPFALVWFHRRLRGYPKGHPLRGVASLLGEGYREKRWWWDTYVRSVRNNSATHYSL